MLIEEQRGRMLHIIDCIKQVIGPEAPLPTFKITLLGIHLSSNYELTEVSF
jgi:hypothetical protein